MKSDEVRRIARLFVDEHRAELRATSCDDPILVNAFSAREASFWRVPLIRAGRHSGFIDVTTSGSVARYSLHGNDPNYGLSLTEMSPADIRQQVLTSLGSGFDVGDDPQLVSLGSETRLAWRVHGVDGRGRGFEAVVTPGMAWIEGSSPPVPPSNPRT